MGLTQVSTDGVKNDAITKAKIPANQIEASELADNAVDTNAIADQAVALSKLPHGDGNSDGKFLRANNGADPSFETVTSTTINNNGDNKVITGSGTANTLEAESTLTWNGTLLDINQSGTGETGLKLRNSEGGLYVRSNDDKTFIDTDQLIIRTEAETERMRIASNGEVGINISNPETYGISGTGYGGLTVQAPSGGYSGITIRSSYAGGGALFFADGNSSNAERKNLGFTADHVNKRLNWIVEGSTVARFTEHGFHPNPADSAAANALDDYEEGTWSPQIYYQNSGDQSDSTNLASYGWYQKVGNVIHISFFLRWTLTGSAANDNIGVKNFPFVQSPVTSTYGDAGGIGSISHSGTSLNATDCIVLKSAGSGSTLMYLEDIGSQGNRGNEFGANSGMRVWGSVTYRTT